MKDYIKLHKCAHLIEDGKGPEIFPRTQVGSEFSNFILGSSSRIAGIYSIEHRLKYPNIRIIIGRS